MTAGFYYYLYPLHVAEMAMYYSDIWCVKSLDISDRMRGDTIMSPWGARCSAYSILRAMEGSAAGGSDDIAAV